MGKNEAGLDYGAAMRFYGDTLKKLIDLSRQIDMQVNMITSLSSVLLAFSVTQIIQQHEPITFAVLSVCMVCAVISALFAAHPPRFMRRAGQHQSAMYSKSIARYPSAVEYEAQLRSFLSDADAMVGEYAREIYNLSKYYYIPKRKLYLISRNFFVSGIALATITFITTLLI